MTDITSTLVVRAPQVLKASALPVLSPYFQTTDTRKEANGQGYIFILCFMIGNIERIEMHSGSTSYSYVSLIDAGETVAIGTIGFDPTTVTSAATFFVRLKGTIDECATSNSTTVTEYCFGGIPLAMLAGLANAPQAAIANAPADATTNYNVVTTLLGTLTSAVNTANTKQNDIATKFNSLLAELRTLGLIST